MQSPTFLTYTLERLLARAINERVHVHNERNFPQAKLDRELNARFVLNRHSNLCFLLHNNRVNIILLNLKKINKFYRKEKRHR